MGLTITKRLVTGMGGTIGLKSQPGSGSLFHVQFELDTTEAVAEVQDSPRNYKSPQIDLTGLKVLVVDDNAVNRKVVVRLLADFSCEGFVVENGQEALNALAGGHFDLVLMDCQMPVMDGFEATRKIRSGKAEYSNIPIIALTASALAQDREKCLKCGMDDFLCKPIRREELRSALERWVEPKRPRRHEV